MSGYKKNYLKPKAWRRGQPTLVFMTKENGYYWLGIYSDLIEFPRGDVYLGQGREYNQVSKSKISKRTYDALIAERNYNYAKRNPDNKKNNNS